MRIILSASDVTLALRGPGEGIGDRTGVQPVGNDLVPLDQVALVISDHANGQEVTVVGTAQTLRSLVVEGLSLPVPEGVPLFDTV